MSNPRDHPAPSLPPMLSSRHITSLDGFRGLAFLLVFARHYGLSSHLATPWILFLERWGQGGWVGVDLFFALSGFLITGILLDTAGHPHFFRNFMARRALRIFPLYYGVALLLLLMTPLLHLQWHPEHLWYLAYLGNVAQCKYPDVTTVLPAVNLLHLWSLSVEEQFYLLWPGVIYLLVRGGQSRRLPAVCLGLSGLAFLLRLALFARLPEGNAIEWSYALLFTHMDGLLYGAVAAWAYRSYSLPRLLARARWVFAAALLVVAVVIHHAGPDFYSKSMVLFGFPALGMLFSSLLVLALPRGSAAGRVGDLRILRFFGRYSYGMYVFHMLFWPATAPLLGWLEGTMHSRVAGGFTYLAVILGATSLVSVLSFNLSEKHWLRLKSRFADRAASPAPAIAS